MSESSSPCVPIPVSPDPETGPVTAYESAPIMCAGCQQLIDESKGWSQIEVRRKRIKIYPSGGISERSPSIAVYDYHDGCLQR